MVWLPQWMNECLKEWRNVQLQTVVSLLNEAELENSVERLRVTLRPCRGQQGELLCTVTERTAHSWIISLLFIIIIEVGCWFQLRLRCEQCRHQTVALCCPSEISLCGLKGCSLSAMLEWRVQDLMRAERWDFTVILMTLHVSLTHVASLKKFLEGLNRKKVGYLSDVIIMILLIRGRLHCTSSQTSRLCHVEVNDMHAD